MTPAQQQTLATALRAETNSNVVNYLANRMDVQLADWCNSNSTTDAWIPDMTAKGFFEAMDVTKYDGLTAGKRDAYRQMQDFSPIDMAKNANRKAIADIWGNTDSVAVLQSCVRKATRAEAYLGGTSATTNTVTALKLSWTGTVSVSEVSECLNRF